MATVDVRRNRRTNRESLGTSHVFAKIKACTYWLRRANGWPSAPMFQTLWSAALPLILLLHTQCSGQGLDCPLGLMWNGKKGYPNTKKKTQTQLKNIYEEKGT